MSFSKKQTKKKTLGLLIIFKTLGGIWKPRYTWVGAHRGGSCMDDRIADNMKNHAIHFDKTRKCKQTETDLAAVRPLFGGKKLFFAWTVLSQLSSTGYIVWWCVIIFEFYLLVDFYNYIHKLEIVFINRFPIQATENKLCKKLKLSTLNVVYCHRSGDFDENYVVYLLKLFIISFTRKFLHYSIYTFFND